MGNDLMGLGVLEFLKEKNIEVPKDIKIVCFDNTDFASLSGIEFTSIDLMQDEIGRTAAKLLLERLKGKRKESKKVIIIPKLIIRKSSLNG